MMQFYLDSEDEEIADKIPEVLYNLSGKIIQAELEGKIRSCCTWLLSCNVSQNCISSYKNIFNMRRILVPLFFCKVCKLLA